MEPSYEERVQRRAEALIAQRLLEGAAKPKTIEQICQDLADAILAVNPAFTFEKLVQLFGDVGLIIA